MEGGRKSAVNLRQDYPLVGSRFEPGTFLIRSCGVNQLQWQAFRSDVGLIMYTRKTQPGQLTAV